MTQEFMIETTVKRGDTMGGGKIIGNQSFGLGRRRMGLCGAGLFALAAAGCASAPEPKPDAYAAVEYTGARQVYEFDRLAPLSLSSEKAAATGEYLAPVKFEGIAGARLAHQMYEPALAEKFDGHCENRVRVGAQESLIDIADFCDIPVAELVGFNPAIDNPYLVRAGAVIDIPSRMGVSGQRGALTMRDDLTALYAVQKGDTIESIAYRYEISANTILAGNPQARQRALQPGELIRLPGVLVARDASDAGASARWGVPAPATPRVKRDANGRTPPSANGAVWEGYAGETAPAAPSPSLDEVTAVMPYRLGPTNEVEVTRRGPANPAPALATDRRIVRPGERVRVSVANLPAGASVTFYRGKTLEDMASAATVTAGADGVATTSYLTPKRPSDMGGYVFKAVRADTGETYYSNRVGVLKLDGAE